MTPAAAIARRCLMPAIERPEPVAKPEPAAPPPQPARVNRGRGGSSKRCTIDGIAYESYTAAAKAHGIVPMSVLWRVEHLDWPGWTAEGVVKFRTTINRRKPCSCEGRRYPGIGEAAKGEGLAKATVSRWCKLGLHGWRYE